MTPFGIVADSNDEQFSKALAPMLVNSGEISKVVSSVQPLNAKAPMLVTGVENSTVSRLVSSSNMYEGMVSNFVTVRFFTLESLSEPKK